MDYLQLAKDYLAEAERKRETSHGGAGNEQVQGLVAMGQLAAQIASTEAMREDGFAVTRECVHGLPFDETATCPECEAAVGEWERDVQNRIGQHRDDGEVWERFQRTLSNVSNLPNGF